VQNKTRTHALSYPRFHWFRSSGNALRYGLRQESELRRGLSADQKLHVHHDETEDAIYKMDAIVRFRNAPLLPAVGIQFTTKPDLDKVNRTIAVVRRTRIVSRLLYLEAECALNESAFPLIADLIRFLADGPAERGIVCAVLTTDGKSKYWFRDLKCFPLETAGDRGSQQKEERAA
jgi:hypothetical protein